MYIRQTKTNNSATGESYFTHRLVRGERVQGKVRQITLLNLGRHFPVNQSDWPLLCLRIEQLLSGQAALLAVDLTTQLEQTAQRVAGRLIARAPASAALTPSTAEATPQSDFQEVDVDSLQLTQPRSVGVEHVGLRALAQLGLIDKLAALGVNGAMRAAIIGSIIGRMAKPASELSSWHWLRQHSALGELIDFDFEAMPLMRLYRASDVLMRHRQALEQHLFSAATTLFDLQPTVTLYDLTNSYCEGAAAANAKAKRGRSKEKRSDCPLVTLGLVLDGSGFVRRSQVFAGNVAECSTLEPMLTGLQAPPGALVVMDAGIASEANIAWLVEHHYRYLVVSRSRTRQFDPSQAVDLETANGGKLQHQKTLSEDGKEVRLYCHSEGREQKEKSMLERASKDLIAGLQKLADGLHKPRGEKRNAKILERIGRLKERSHGASQHLQINVSTDADGNTVNAISWEQTPVQGSMATHPGVYCLRSNQTDWDAEQLWRTYTLLTDLESVFRSLKSELGLRPIYHSTEARVDGHLFITVLAYQCVQVIRKQLGQAENHQSWSSLRDTLSVQRRVTTSLRQRDGRTLNLRKSTVAEPDLMQIYQALHINPAPGGTKKLVC